MAEVNALGGVISRPDATDADALRAAVRVEVCLEQLAEGYRDILRAEPGTATDRRWRLLRDVHLDLLRQILDWLDELVDALHDPVGSLKRRGRPATGAVHLDIMLTLRPSSGLQELADWLGHRATADPLPSAEPSPKRRSGSGSLRRCSRSPSDWDGSWATTIDRLSRWGIGTNAVFWRPRHAGMRTRTSAHRPKAGPRLPLALVPCDD